MEPIFNESFVKKEVCKSREQCTRSTRKQTTATGCFSKKKKKKGNAKRWMLGNSLVHKRVLKVCLGSAYFAKIENFLLKILYVGAN